MTATIAKNTLRFPDIPLLPNLYTSDTYTVDLRLSLTNTDKGPVFLAFTTLTPTGAHTPILSTGEPNIAIDMLKNAYPNNPYIEKLTTFISTYDKNHMHAGTQRQENAIREAVKEKALKDCSQTEIVNYLKSIRMYVDDSVRDADGSPHRYGHGWIYTGIPEDDMRELSAIISGENMPDDIGHVISNQTKTKE